MPVESNALIVHIIVDGHLDGITPVSLNGRTGETAVDEQTVDLITIRGNLASGDGEVIGSNDTCVGMVFVVVGEGIPLAPRETIGSRVVSEEVGESGSVLGSQDGLAIGPRLGPGTSEVMRGIAIDVVGTSSQMGAGNIPLGTGSVTHSEASEGRQRLTDPAD